MIISKQNEAKLNKYHQLSFAKTEQKRFKSGDHTSWAKEQL